MSILKIQMHIAPHITASTYQSASSPAYNKQVDISQQDNIMQAHIAQLDMHCVLLTDESTAVYHTQGLKFPDYNQQRHCPCQGAHDCNGNCVQKAWQMHTTLNNNRTAPAQQLSQPCNLSSLQAQGRVLTPSWIQAPRRPRSRRCHGRASLGRSPKCGRPAYASGASKYLVSASTAW